MIAYIDPSVILRILFRERHPLKSFKRVKLGVSSEIFRVECLRVVDRFRLTAPLTDIEVVSLHREVHNTCASMEQVRISPLVLGMASQPYPTTVRTLDALHLASALLWSQSRETSLVFLTHDRQLGIAAQSLGFQVDGID